jgi:hypothetical protein
MDYTLADLAHITGAKRRSLQLWADARAIVAELPTDHAGTGVHRRFSRDEAIIACILSAFASHQISIGGLVQIAKSVRTYLNVSGTRKLVIEPAIAGDDKWMLVYESWNGGSKVHASPEHPDLKNVRKPGGFAVIICLSIYLSKIGR